VTVPAPDPAVTEEAELGGRARSGIRWSLLNSAAARGLNVVAGLAIARLVAPDEFGSYAAGLVVLTALLSMNEIGVSVAIVRWQGDVKKVAPTAVTCALASSLAWFLLAFFGAPLIGSILKAPEAIPVIRILSFGLLLDGLSSIPNALLMRAFQQRRRAVADLLGFVIGALTGIGLAAAGWGAPGLAIGLVVTNAVTTAAIFRLAPMLPWPRWNRVHARALVRSGLPAASTSLVLLAIINVDYVVISRELGLAALGFYVLAFNIASWPWNLLSLSIRQVSLPAFSRLAGNRDGLELAFSRSLTLAAGTAVLGGLLLAGLAGPIVHILYGDRWLHAVDALRWLALLGALRVVLDLCYDLLVAAGRAGSLLKVQLGWLALLAVALPIGAHVHGIAGVAVAHSVVAAAVVLPLHVLLVVGTGLRLSVLLRAAAPVGAAAVAAGAIALMALRIDVSPVWTVLVVGSLVAAAYIAVFALANGGRTAVAWATARQST
jgi:O-antigen/teichoic acid export membrane protein